MYFSVYCVGCHFLTTEIGLEECPRPENLGISTKIQTGKDNDIVLEIFAHRGENSGDSYIEGSYFSESALARIRADGA